MSLTLDQMREGARLLASHTAIQDQHTLTAETTVTLGQTGSAVGLPTHQKQSTESSFMVSVAEPHLREATSHMS
jgi:hypothetical protein